MSKPKLMMTRKQADKLAGKLDVLAGLIDFEICGMPDEDSPEARRIYGQMLSCADALRKAAGVR